MNRVVQAFVQLLTFVKIGTVKKMVITKHWNGRQFSISHFELAIFKYIREEWLMALSIARVIIIIYVFTQSMVSFYKVV